MHVHVHVYFNIHLSGFLLFLPKFGDFALAFHVSELSSLRYEDLSPQMTGDKPKPTVPQAPSIYSNRMAMFPVLPFCASWKERLVGSAHN